MNQLKKYRLFCNAENKHVFTDYRETPPVHCTNDITHDIDVNSIVSTDTIDLNISKVDILHEEIETGGHYRYEINEFSIPNEIGWHEIELSWPIPINILRSEYHVSDNNNENDRIEASTGKNSVVGVLTENSYVDQNILSVNETVMQYLKLGLNVSITDGINFNDLGRCVEHSVNNENKIKTEFKVSNDFSADSPTSVMMTKYFVKNNKIGYAKNIIFGGGKIGSSYLPDNTILTIRYYNTENIDKKVFIHLEYLF